MSSDQPAGFSVMPKMNCPHILNAIAHHDEVPTMPPFPNKCSVCNEGPETWVCVSCIKIGCSRYIAGHANEHFKQTNHPIAISYSDCSAWCYICEDYIEGPTIRPFISAVQHAKFDTPKPNQNQHQHQQTNPSTNNTHEEAASSSSTSTQEEITKLTEKGQVIAIQGAKPTETLFIENSIGCEITLESGEIKALVLSGCKNCKIVCKIPIVSGKIGVKASNKIAFSFTKDIGNIILEDSENIQIGCYGVESKHPFETVHTTRCIDVSIKVRGNEGRYRIHSNKTRTVVTQIVKNAIVSEFADGGKATSEDNDVSDDGQVHQGEAGVAIPPEKRKRGHTNPEDIQEFFDNPELIDKKVAQVVALMKKPDPSNPNKFNYVNTIVYTGAGISTSAKIPDYRGPQGAWTMADEGKSCRVPITFEEARPTIAHMAISELVRRGIVTFVCSTNVDGLHLKSGVPSENLAELHGNAFLEICRNCKARYSRPFDVTSNKGNDMVDDVHSTGRKCDSCGEALYDSIVHFGESLPVSDLRKSVKKSNESNVSIVLGTSLLVHPACDIPMNAPNVVIVNLQKTQFDSMATVRIFTKTDEFMIKLMSLLGIPIPEYVPQSQQPQQTNSSAPTTSKNELK